MSINEIERRLEQFGFLWDKKIIHSSQLNDEHNKNEIIYLNLTDFVQQMSVHEEVADQTTVTLYQSKTNSVEYIWKLLNRPWNPLLLDENSFTSFIIDIIETSRLITRYLSDIIEGNDPIQERFFAVSETLDRFNRACFKDNEHPALQKARTLLFNLIWRTSLKEHPYFFDRYDSWKNNRQVLPKTGNKTTIKKKKLTPEICEMIASITIDGMAFINESINGSKGELLFKLFTANPSSAILKGIPKNKLYCRDWDNNDVYYLIRKLNEYVSPLISQTKIENHQMLYLKEGHRFSRNRFDTKTTTNKLNEYIKQNHKVAKQIDDQVKALFFE